MPTDLYDDYKEWVERQTKPYSHPVVYCEICWREWDSCMGVDCEETRALWSPASLEEKMWWVHWLAASTLPCGCKSHVGWPEGVHPCAGPMLPH